MRGQAIAQVESNVRRIDANEYRVRSQSGNGEYIILSTEIGWTCSCPDATILDLPHPAARRKSDLTALRDGLLAVAEAKPEPADRREDTTTAERASK